MLGPILSGIQGLGTARLGYSQGRGQQQQAEAEKQQAIQQMMFKLALEKAARDQTQANADRDFGLRKTESETRTAAEARQAQREAFMESQSKPPVLGTPEYEAATLGLEAGKARINSQYKEPRRDPVADAISILRYKEQHPTEATTTLPDGTVIQAGGKAQKPPTEAQAKANSYLKLAEAEEPTIEGMTSNLPNKYLNKVPVLGNIITGAKNPKYQEQVAAGERFINQYLRFQSGAAISESEFENARKQFIPQPGDTEATIAAKAAARHRVIEGLREATRQGATSSASGATPAQEQFKAASMRLQEQHDAAIERGVNPAMAQLVLEREMAKLRKNFK